MTNWVFLIFLRKDSKVIKNLIKRVCCSLLIGGVGDMEEFPRMLYGWSWEENKLFELALAVVDEDDPDRWKAVASMVGGNKSAEDVQKHYVILLQDLQCIESGGLDHALADGDSHASCVHVDCTQSVCWSEEDHELLVQLDIN